MTEAKISKDLQILAVPIDSVRPLETNARRGNVPAVVKSLRKFGQRKPIVVRRETGEVTAGNHMLLAAIKLGWETIAVSWEDDDEATAEAYALADNNTHDMGLGYDEIGLNQMILRVAEVDLELLEATGYDTKLAEPPPPPKPTGASSSVVSYTLVFEDEEQQKVWYDFMRWLRKQYPEIETNGDRVTEFLNGYFENLDDAD